MKAIWAYSYFTLSILSPVIIKDLLTQLTLHFFLANGGIKLDWQKTISKSERAAIKGTGLKALERIAIIYFNWMPTNKTDRHSLAARALEYVWQAPTASLRGNLRSRPTRTQMCAKRMVRDKRQHRFRLHQPQGQPLVRNDVLFMSLSLTLKQPGSVIFHPVS